MGTSRTMFREQIRSENRKQVNKERTDEADNVLVVPDNGGINR